MYHRLAEIVCCHRTSRLIALKSDEKEWEEMGFTAGDVPQRCSPHYFLLLRAIVLFPEGGIIL